MSKIKNILTFGLLAAVAVPVFTSCNDDWKEEQYKHYISFKAPLATSGSSVGVTTVYVPYTRLNEDKTPKFGAEGKSNYLLPVLVAGSTDNPNTITVNIAPSDTLDILNVERFGHREELYYKDMSDFADVPPTITIHEGQNMALLDVQLDFNKNGGLDLIDRYVLPLTIAPGQGYERNPRKNYATAMLRILPYTTYSGIYQATNLQYCLLNDKGEQDGESAGMETVQAYTCGENEVFMYAGTNTESSLLRKWFRIYVRFEPDERSDGKSGNVYMYTKDEENPDLNFSQPHPARFNIIEAMDAVQTYILRRTLVVKDIEYVYTDTKTAPGASLTYKVAGTLTMERKLNTQMPEEDQIMWD